MKLVGIVGSNAEVSYNRILLKYIKSSSATCSTLEILEIKDIPLFNQSDDQTNSAPVQKLTQKSCRRMASSLPLLNITIQFLPA